MSSNANPQNTGIQIDELDLDEVIRRANRLLDSSGGSLPNSLKFEWSGIEFNVERQQHGEPDDNPGDNLGDNPGDNPEGSEVVVISAILGFIPFTGQNKLGRKEALKVLAEASIRPDSPFRKRPGGLVEYSSTAPSDGLETLPDLLQHVTHRVIETSRPLKRLAAALR